MTNTSFRKLMAKTATATNSNQNTTNTNLLITFCHKLVKRKLHLL